MDTHNESILVCVHYGPHGQRLIQRGTRLAQLLKAPLRVLTVAPSRKEEYNLEKERYVSGWQKQTEEAGGEFMVRKCSSGHKPADVIAEAALELGVTQIIIGRSSQSIWHELTHGDFVDDLLERIGAIDLHIVAVQRYPELLEETHEKGMPARLIRTKSHYVLETGVGDSPVGEDIIEGTFFRELDTDFDSGLFKVVKNGQAEYLKIIQGEWVKS
ncbi:universal stress protein [Saccharibacillus sp. JS10]|uniref:universal stress protein n=1 Tax=Saccharibacillus sp. JS10 TaxID=2950552 RepID=UPI00210B94BC|nr:universal stress protein [Saccharibacillus sp. JS10]MCQ4088580.1 universal stress protein [Saccharibacillus sp. JS10]